MSESDQQCAWEYWQQFRVNQSATAAVRPAPRRQTDDPVVRRIREIAGGSTEDAGRKLLQIGQLMRKEVEEGWRLKGGAMAEAGGD